MSDFAKDTNVPINDCISRQDAIDAIAHMHCKKDEDGYVWIIRRDVWARIEALPSAKRKGKSAQRKGEWIATQDWGGRNYSCSCCKFSFMVDTCMLEPMWNYCPNCGAEMKGEEDV